MCCVIQPLYQWVRDVPEAMDHSEVVAMVVTKVGARTLA